MGGEESGTVRAGAVIYLPTYGVVVYWGVRHDGREGGMQVRYRFEVQGDQWEGTKGGVDTGVDWIACTGGVEALLLCDGKGGRIWDGWMRINGWVRYVATVGGIPTLPTLRTCCDARRRAVHTSFLFNPAYAVLGLSSSAGETSPLQDAVMLVAQRALDGNICPTRRRGELFRWAQRLVLCLRTRMPFCLAVCLTARKHRPMLRYEYIIIYVSSVGHPIDR